MRVRRSPRPKKREAPPLSVSSVLGTPPPPVPVPVPMPATQATQATQECTEGDTHTQPCTQQQQHSSASPREWATLVCHADSRAILLVKQSVLLGRGAFCDVSVPQKRVSERHCRIERTQMGGAVLCDNHSTNGTWHNGRRLAAGQSVPLITGDEVSLLARNQQVLEATFSFYPTELPAGDAGTSGFSQAYILSPVLLGTGVSSEVRECTERRTGQRCAVKIVKKRRFAGCKKALDCIQSEVKILSKLKHPNIVRYVDIFEDEKNLFIILELVPGGDLLKRLDRDDVIPERLARFIFKQLLDGVAYLHKNKITHRDLKPANILLGGSEESPVPKISDFGVAHNLLESEMMTTVCGTPQYAAPEILLRGSMFVSSDSESQVRSYGREVDMWSLGVILYMILSGTPPFSEEGRVEPMFDQITKGLYSFPEREWAHISSNAIDLIKKLLTADPAARLTAADALCHPWFGEVPSPTVLRMPHFPISPEEKRHKLLSLRRVAVMSPSALHHLQRLNPASDGPRPLPLFPVVGTPEKPQAEVLAPDSDEDSLHGSGVPHTPLRKLSTPTKRKLVVRPPPSADIVLSSPQAKAPKFSLPPETAPPPSLNLRHNGGTLRRHSSADGSQHGFP